MDREIKIGKKYRHFKGHIYEVILIAKNTEDLNDLVIYKNVETNECWARPLDMFISEVDHEKYPSVLQKYRFEEIEDE